MVGASWIRWMKANRWIKPLKFSERLLCTVYQFVRNWASCNLMFSRIGSYTIFSVESIDQDSGFHFHHLQKTPEESSIIKCLLCDHYIHENVICKFKVDSSYEPLGDTFSALSQWSALSLVPDGWVDHTNSKRLEDESYPSLHGKYGLFPIVPSSWAGRSVEFLKLPVLGKGVQVPAA